MPNPYCYGLQGSRTPEAKIKIHKLSSATTLLLSDWLTNKWESAEISDGQPPSSGNKTGGKKAFLLAKQRSRWLHESTLAVSLVIPPLAALHFHRRHSSPKHAHMPRAHWFGPHDKLLLGLLSKNQHSPEGVAGEGWEEEGCGGGEGGGQGEGGRPTKHCLSITPDKREGQISPAADKQEEFHFNHKSVRLWSENQPPEKEGRGANICRGDKGRGKKKGKKVPACCFASLRASRGDGGMRLFFCDTPMTPPLSVFGCALSKTKHCTHPRAFCFSCHAHSFYVPSTPLLHPFPSSAAVAPSLFPSLSPPSPLGKQPVISSFVCFVCDHWLEK